MSKPMKILCLAAAGMVAFGIALSGFAYMLGAGRSLSRTSDGWNYDENGMYNPIGLAVKEDTFDSFSSIDLDIDYQEVTLQVGDAFHIESRYDGKHSSVTFELKDGTLKVIEDSKRMRREFPWILTEPKRQAGKLTITYPAGTEFTSVLINCDMADITVSDMIVNMLEADADLGTVRIDNVMAGSLDIYADMGDISLTDSSADEATLNCSLGAMETDNFVSRQSFTAETSAGDVDLEGDFQGVTKIDCSLGDVSAELRGKRADYGYYLKTDLGTVEVNGYDTGNRERGEGGPHHLEITNSAGDIEVNFGENDR